jgi:prolyl-tRNA editing enzyme YbaK/EbsC (Cys-tRNA(Pro) deacylase)
MTTFDVWNADHVRRTLAERAPDIEVLEFDASTATSQLAAQQVGCDLGQIAKSIVFLVDDKPVIVVTSGDMRVDDRKIADRFGVSRKKIRTASAEECVAITGYAPGGVPPFPHRRGDIALYIDISLQRYERVFAAAGASNAIMPIAFDELAALTGGTIADFAKTTELGTAP